MGHALRKSAEFGPEAYLAWEVEQTERHEYVDGEVFLMTGTTQFHNLIAGNLLIALREKLRGKPCRVFMESLKLRVEAANCFFYPDLMVTCSPRDRLDPLVLSEPVLVVEVLSESSASYDLGRKFAAYRQLPSLREYVVVHQDEARVLVYRRGEGVEWILHPYGPDDFIQLSSLGCGFPLSQVYEDIEF